MLESFNGKFFLTTIIVLLLAISLCSASIRDFNSSAQTQAKTLGIVIPLYSYPGPQWNTVIQAKDNFQRAVYRNNKSRHGPGDYQDSNYVRGVKEMQAAGIIVLGYVDTAYASDDISSVEANARLYDNWYHVDGIMFDDMSNTTSDESYYAT